MGCCAFEHLLIFFEKWALQNHCRVAVHELTGHPKLLLCAIAQEVNNVVILGVCPPNPWWSS